MNRHHRALYLGVVLALGFTLTGCGERVHGAPKPGDDIEIPAFTWRVRTPEQIADEYKRGGKEMHPGQYVDAYIGRVNGRPAVTTGAPVYVDDRVACSLGHEVMHAGLGDYHARKEAK